MILFQQRTHNLLHYADLWTKLNNRKRVERVNAINAE